MKIQLFTTASIFSLLFLFGCKKEELFPDADFVKKATAEVGEVVKMTNLSRNATEYIWDFGDGNGSVEEEPKHIYEKEGTYTVKLTAFGHETRDVSTETIVIESAFINIERGVRAGDFYLKEDLRTHFAKLDTSKMNYRISKLTTVDGFRHCFDFRYAGISFYIFTTTESYSLDQMPFQIDVSSPFIGQTKGALSFGSRFEEVVDIFGTPYHIVESNEQERRIGTYFYEGINFSSLPWDPDVYKISILDQ